MMMMMDDDDGAGDAAVHRVLRNAASHCSLEAEAGSYAVVLHARRAENGRHISIVCLGFFVTMFIWFCSIATSYVCCRFNYCDMLLPGAILSSLLRLLFIRFIRFIWLQCICI